MQPNHNSDYRVISFDLDRTLIFHARSAKQDQVVTLLQAQGLEVTAESYRAATHLAREFYDVLGYHYASNPTQLRYDYVQLVLQRLGCGDAQLIAHVADFYQRFDDDPANFYTPPEAKSLLLQLQRGGFQLFAISSNLMATQRVQHCGVAGMFQEVLTPVLGVAKAELYRRLIAQSDALPNQVLHVGDDPILDVLAPQRLGIHALLFDPDNRYATLPWQHIVRSYTELEQRINAEVGTVQL